MILNLILVWKDLSSRPDPTNHSGNLEFGFPSPSHYLLRQERGRLVCQSLRTGDSRSVRSTVLLESRSESGPRQVPSLTRYVFSVLWETGFGFMAAEGQRPAKISGRVEGMLQAVEKEKWFTHLHSHVLRLSHVRLELVGAAILETGRSLGGSRERK